MAPGILGWFERYKSYWEENGYHSAPERTYQSFIKYIRNNGKILELGCGNGLLLKYICDHSSRILVPFGVDINAAAIGTAKEFIHPERAFAFEVGDVARHKFPHAPYQTIIINPLYVNEGYIEQGKLGRNTIERYYEDGTVTSYVERCFANVTAGGRLIVWCYIGQMREISDHADTFSKDISVVHDASFTEEDTICVWVMNKSAQEDEPTTGR